MKQYRLPARLPSNSTSTKSQGNTQYLPIY
uniref:Uncharacterized protein n=1 Tax=Arundo donax TaxID=35708 RepID=A0A0A8Z471_ARUDO